VTVEQRRNDSHEAVYNNSHKHQNGSRLVQSRHYALECTQKNHRRHSFENNTPLLSSDLNGSDKLLSQHIGRDVKEANATDDKAKTTQLPGLETKTDLRDKDEN